MTLALDLYFIPIRLVDLVEIAILSFVLYHLYRLMRGTVALQILFGLLALSLLENLVTAFNMRVLRSLFSTVSEVFVLAIIILFQPEIRRVLLVIAQNPLVRRFVQTNSNQPQVVDQVVTAVMEMSHKRIGALVAFARTTGLRTYVETGTRLHAEVTSELLIQIFLAKSPLHDGAVVIQDGKLEAARCILPVSQSRRIDHHLGLRHRAAVGLTEQTDALVVIVSEERGTISIAEKGTLTLNVSEAELRQRLLAGLASDATTTTPIAALADV